MWVRKLRYGARIISPNGSHIAEGGNFGAENLNIKLMYNRSKNVHITTDLPLLAICCYVPFLFTNQ